ncbi:hypothetical protein [uncultured Devosia sp.]|uniref:hypothetical protein n=1 Tax=uncultured Devosia sp. TaxID=211434 RepID=UPI002618993B|nr:hypothetical protein [uncultured Devosia sp.]
MNLFKTLRIRAFALLAFALFVSAPQFVAPAFALKIATATADGMLDARKAEYNSGTIVIYSGTEPADPDTALSGNTALATFTFSTTACGSDSTSSTYRVCTLSFSASTVTASATGTATFARGFKSDGTTVIEDWTVGTSGADINLNSTAITSGGNVTLSSMTLKQPFH